MKTFASATSRSKPIVYVSSHFGENLTRISEGSTVHRILFTGSVWEELYTACWWVASVGAGEFPQKRILAIRKGHMKEQQAINSFINSFI